jgi:hypothetical protein
VTGFLRGLFGSKNKTKDESAEKPTGSKDKAKAQPAEKPAPQPRPKPVPQPRRASDAYYLGADDAKTYGNLEYMRQAKTVRHTFPKTAGGQEKESIRAVSSMETQSGNPETLIKQAASFSEAAANLEQAKANVDPVAERRRSDPNMSTFRNMAKQIRKK